MAYAGKACRLRWLSHTYFVYISENELEFMYVFMINSQIQWRMQFAKAKIMRDLRGATRHTHTHTRMNTILTETMCGVARPGLAGLAWYATDYFVYNLFLVLREQAPSVFVHERNDRMMNEP